MSSARDTLMNKFRKSNHPTLTDKELKILQNAITHDLTERKNGLNVPALKQLYKHISDQKGISKMTRRLLVRGLQTRLARLLQSKSKNMSGSVLPRPIQGKFVKQIALDGPPVRVACHAGKAYVTHTMGGKISVLDVESGALVEEWTIPRGAMLTSVVVHREHVFVVDSTFGYIRVLDMEGKQERQFSTLGSIKGKLSSPSDMAIAGDLVYVSDQNKHRVQVFGLDGTWVRSWGSKGAGEGEFKNPIGITVHNDEVYVADRNNHRVQVFGLDGMFRRMWGSRGRGDGEFFYLRDVIVHGELVYVADAFNERVQSFRASDGEFLGSFGTKGSARPEGLCVDDKDRMWVCDYRNSRLQLFR